HYYWLKFCFHISENSIIRRLKNANHLYDMAKISAVFGGMAERSKACGSGPHLLGGAGSNPASISLFCFLEVFNGLFYLSYQGRSPVLNSLNFAHCTGR